MMLMVSAAIAFLMAALIPAAQAADISLGVGVGLAPEFEGSKDYKAVPLP